MAVAASEHVVASARRGRRPAAPAQPSRPAWRFSPRSTVGPAIAANQDRRRLVAIDDSVRAHRAVPAGLGRRGCRRLSCRTRRCSRTAAGGVHGARVDLHSATGRLVRTLQSAAAAERQGVRRTEATVLLCGARCVVRFSRRACSEACERSGRRSINAGREPSGGVGTERPPASSGGTDRGDSISPREAQLRVQARQSVHGGSGSCVRVFQATGRVARRRAESARLGGFAGAVS